MTFKQFFEIAGGAVVGLLIYALPLPGLIRWPLVIIAVIMGAAFAFLPIQERPFEEWLAAFFRSIYSPTLYYWTNTAVKRQYFASPQEAMAVQPEIPPQAAQIVSEEQPKQSYLNNLEETEKSFLSSITNLIKFPGSKPASPAGRTPAPAPPPEPKAVAAPAQQVVATPQQGYQPQVQQKTVNIQVNPVAQTLTSQQQQARTQAQYSQAAAPPTPPTQPNVLVGQVLDGTGKIVAGAVLEVKDMFNRPARALKTNNAGHFSIVTPLTNGNYQIVTEKEGLTFDPVSFEAKGQIIPPIAIKSK